MALACERAGLDGWGGGRTSPLLASLCWSRNLPGLGCSSANKCLLKVAAYAAQLEQYQRAIEIYEQVGGRGPLCA